MNKPLKSLTTRYEKIIGHNAKAATLNKIQKILATHI